MAGVATTCEECEGKRFEASVLEYHLGGRDISEVLAMSVERGAGVLRRRATRRRPPPHKILERLADVGLGYLTLGQPLTTLSGGERQRLKLATHMGEKGGVYVLDEPTTGLHLADVEQLLGLLDRLVDAGKSVIVIEHHQAVMAHADWIIDLGPGAGHDGGRIVFEGTPGRPRRRPLDAHRRAPRGVRRRVARSTSAGTCRPSGVSPVNELVLPHDEPDRLRALYDLGILDTPDEERFDRITRTTARMFDVPIALVSLVDEERQWAKSCVGLDGREIPRSFSLCSQAILGDHQLVIEDTLGRPRVPRQPAGHRRAAPALLRRPRPDERDGLQARHALRRLAQPPHLLGRRPRGAGRPRGLGRAGARQQRPRRGARRARRDRGPPARGHGHRRRRRHQLRRGRHHRVGQLRRRAHVRDAPRLPARRARRQAARPRPVGEDGGHAAGRPRQRHRPPAGGRRPPRRLHDLPARADRRAHARRAGAVRRRRARRDRFRLSRIRRAEVKIAD